MSETCNSLKAQVGIFSAYVTSDSLTSLDVLNAIDEVVDTCALSGERLRSNLEKTYKYIEAVQKCGPGVEIDPDDAVSGHFLTTEATLQELAHEVEARVKKALAHPDFPAQHRDGFLSECTAVINHCLELRNAVRTLRLSVMEHDADASETVGPFDSVEDMLAVLKA